MPNIVELTREDVGGLLSSKGEWSFVDVWGPACAPCVALSPTFAELAAQYAEAVFYKLEAPRNRMACVDLKVSSLPTFLAFNGGREVDRLVGEVDDAKLRAWISNLLGD